MHQITLFQDKKSKKFLGRGHSPSHTPLPVGRGTPSPHTPPPSAPPPFENPGSATAVEHDVNNNCSTIHKIT